MLYDGRNELTERIGAGRGEAGDLARVHARLPQHDAVALDVEAASTGAAGQLGVLPRRDVGVRLAVPLRELLDHHRAGGHVDARAPASRSRRPTLTSPRTEQLLHALLEGRQHPGVVGRDAARQPVEELVVAEHLQVVVGQVAAALLDVGEDLVALLGVGEPDVGRQALRDRRVAADPAEDEHDRGQQALAVEPLEHLDPARDPHPAAVADLARVLGRSGLALARRLAVAHQPRAGPVVARDPDQLVVDRRALLHEARAGVDVGGGEQVEQPAADHDVLEQRHRAALLDDRGRLAAHGGQPLAELLGVGDRRRQRDQR